MPDFKEVAKNCLQAGSSKYSQIALQMILQENVAPSEKKQVYELVEKAWHPALQLAALLWLVKMQVMWQELSQLLGFESSTLERLKSITPLEVYFPAYGSGQGVSSRRVILYILSNEESRAICLKGAGIESADHLADLSAKSCIIAFDAPVEGNSWQMSALAALQSKTRLSAEYAFSGIVTATGEIRTASFLEEKLAFCKERGIKLIHRIDSAKKLEKWLNEEQIPLPLLQYFGSEIEQMRCLVSIEKCIQESQPWFSIAALEDWYGIAANELILGDAGLLPFEPKLWQDFLCETVKGAIEGLRQKMGEKGIIWFLAGQISALQFGIGAVIGFKQALGILQLDFSSSRYKEVVSLYGQTNARELKNVSKQADNFSKIKVNLELNKPESLGLSLILYLGSHNPIGEAKAYSRTYLDVENYLIIEAKDAQGVMNLDTDWLPWVQEINSALNEVRGKHYWQRIHLFQTAPTALCMALGVAFGHFMPITVYHYQFGAPEPRYKAMYELVSCFP
ncbi:MAG: SAVED domain-containing protein [Candidatus Cloacimonetes bacterium]|nr:SAVED domain-containing protein [Candidatus Cloacimonadota bacterium]